METGTRRVPVCEEDQRYAYVTKMLGERRLIAKSVDGKERQCHIPGKFKGKRYWVSPGMLVLLNIRDFQDNKSDVIYIYDEYETKCLQKMGELNVFSENDFQNDVEAFVFEEPIPNKETGPARDVWIDEDINLDDL